MREIRTRAQALLAVRHCLHILRNAEYALKYPDLALESDLGGVVDCILELRKLEDFVDWLSMTEEGARYLERTLKIAPSRRMTESERERGSRG